MNRRVLGASLLGLALLASGASAQPEQQIIPLDLSGQYAGVSVRIGEGAPEQWVFDTGAGENVINVDRAQALNLPNRGAAELTSPAGGTPLAGFHTVAPAMQVGDVALRNVALTAAPAMVVDHGGVLSPYAFRGKLVTLDLAQAQLRISARNGAAAPTSAGTPYHADADGALPIIPITINGHEYWAHMDTGNPHGLTLPYSMASELHFTAPPQQVGMARFVDSTHAVYHGQLQGDVQVGSLTLHNPHVGLIDGLPVLNVGSEILRQMTITLDPERRLSWAVANPAASSPSAH